MNMLSSNWFRFLLLTVLPLHSASAEVILVDDFDYSSGSITTRSGSPWVAHSNTGDNPVQVTSAGVIRIVGNGSSEDVSAPLAGWPTATNTPAVLYAAFKLRYNTVGQLPSGNGGYIAHFRDSRFVYSCRVWATTNNAALGTYRVRISNGSINDLATGGQILQDILLATTNLIVVRLNVSNNVSSIWLNPVAETDVSATATNLNPDPTLAADLGYFAFRQAAGGGTCLIDEVRVGDSFPEVVGTNHPPVISAISDQAITPNTSTAPLSFTVNDIETPATNLIVTALSLDQTLLPDAGLVLTSGETNFTLTVTPAANQLGIARIKLRVTDGDGVTTATTFNLIVGIPEISCLTDQIIATNTTTGPLSFTVGHALLPPESLTVSASSSNPNLISVSNIVFAGTGRVRTMNVTPTLGQSGIATITVTVTAGAATAISTFTVTVQPLLGNFLTEGFNYPDGTGLTGGSTAWQSVGGTPGQVKTVSGAVRLTQTNNESINHSLNLPPELLSTTTGVVLYASCKIRFSQRPANANVNSGGFLVFGGNGPRCNVYALNEGAPAGMFWLAVSENSTDPDYITRYSQALALNTDYTIVLRYNTASEGSTLWVNPISDLSPSVTARSGFVAPVPVSAIGLRQPGGMGTALIDDLKVGTAFYDVMPNVAATAPELVMISRCDGGVQVVWQGDLTGFSLERMSNLDTLWQTATNQGVTNGLHKTLVIYPQVQQEFFRLHKP